MNLQPGTILLDRFRVDAYLGSGGSGAVYRVWDMQRSAALAIKALHPHLVDAPHSQEALLVEARALEELAHPNIVPYYGLYRVPEATFLLEGYIEGASLRQVYAKQPGRPLPYPELKRIFQAICSALQYAHARGIVHCDVKPDNILLDERSQVYLTDFGIAMRQGAALSGKGPRGTPAYMAPEQIRAEQAVPQTDVYALGVMLFEALTGRRPFSGEQAGAAGSPKEKIFWEHLHLPPPAPRAFDPSISPQLEAVTLRCLEKDPARRFAGPMEMYRELAQALAELPGPETAPGQGGEASRRAREKLPPAGLSPVGLLLAGAGVLVLAILLVTRPWAPAPPEPPASQPASAAPGQATPQRPAPTPEPASPAVQPTPVSPTTRPITTLPPAAPALGGSYAVSACMTVRWDAQNRVDECVTGVTILPDGTMRFDFSWTATLQPGAEIEIAAAGQSQDMYLTDDLGNRYDYLQVGGDALRDLTVQNGDVARGWFLFPAPAPGAGAFTFHDDSNLVKTPAMARTW